MLQLVTIAISVPFAAYLAYWLTTGGAPDFRANPNRFVGFGQLVFAGILFGIGAAFAAIVRAREAQARDQAAAFELERSELARQALDSRLRLLQAQVQPHFLFNTLANVKALVDSGSPQASPVLASLIAYLRAAVPRLHDPATTVEQELQLVRAYLELMHMRMPDRLQFSVAGDADALAAECPPMAVLTLVENAVRHGVDPFRGRRPHRRRGARARRPLPHPGARHRRRARAGRRRAGDRAVDAARAPPARLRRRRPGCASSRTSRTASRPSSNSRCGEPRPDVRPNLRPGRAMSATRPTALIADDEPLLRDVLERLLAIAWPELEVIAQARNGREAVTLFEEHRPDVCFLDVHMPGLSGVDAARQIGRRAHLVFVTAFDAYAVEAFAQGALDYLVKPVEAARLADTVERLRARLRGAQPALNTEELVLSSWRRGCNCVAAGRCAGFGRRWAVRSG